ncbi:MAG: hypothetical protein K6T88_16895 [Bacillus sp. (in: Bacteria)]|nr:hypothetical protein [Bacillus sp. (in: firmicutes)]
MLRKVILVKEDEESVKNAIREILKSNSKGHEVAIDLTRITDTKKRAEIMRRLTNY